MGVEAVISLVLGLLLAFRANRAFDRWWEGRIQWGLLVNASRNLAVKINNVVAERDETTKRFCRLLTSYPYLLRDHLCGQLDANSVPDVAAEYGGIDHVPSWVVNQLYGILESWKRHERIHYGEFRMADRELKVLLEVCAACERIRNTPIARSFQVILNHALALFLLTLPWGVVNELGLWTIPVTFLTSYFTISLEGIAEHIEQPFSPGGDGLALDRICESIDHSVREIFDTETIRREATATM